VKKQAARPEDFMDEEDLQDLKDSRNLVDTTEEMDFMSGTQGELRSKANDDETEAEYVFALFSRHLNFIFYSALYNSPSKLLSSPHPNPLSAHGSSKRWAGVQDKASARAFHSHGAEHRMRKLMILSLAHG
jgi:hypothetical protein